MTGATRKLLGAPRRKAIKKRKLKPRKPPEKVML
jgi:hypothetical protein